MVMEERSLRTGQIAGVKRYDARCATETKRNEFCIRLHRPASR